MIDEKEFKQICSDKEFWHYNLKSSLIPYPNVNKEDLIHDLYLKIKSRDYYPSPPRDYLIFNKGKHVLRVVPILKLDDLCVYFYCTRKLEKYIALNRVPGTYGGWSLGGKTKIAEELDLTQYDKENVSVHEFEGDQFVTLDLIGDYAEETNFNPFAWQASWNDFSNKLYKFSVDYQGDFVAEIDIANFYDSIELDYLEYIVRNQTNSEDNEDVNLLFHFLKYWNRHNNFYVNQGAGLPQDIFGECSRILANFYLHSYDEQMFELCQQLGGMYFRYADDQIIFAKSSRDIDFIIANASSFLMKIGLNINQKKVVLMNRDEFDHYFSFNSLINLGGRNAKTVSSESIDNAITFYLSHKDTLRAGGKTLLRAILSCLARAEGKLEKMDDLFALILTEEFLSTHPPLAGVYKRIYTQATIKQKGELLVILKSISQSCLHTDFLFQYRRFLISQSIDFSHVQSDIDRVNNIYGLKL